MYKKLSEKERQEKRELYRKNPIYRILYTPLWRQRGNDLSPLEVWIEANNLAYTLKSDSKIDSIKVQEEFDDLCERFSIFEFEDGEHIRREYSHAEHSAMMVFTAAFFLLLNVFPEAESHPYRLVCTAIYEVIHEIKGFKEIYDEVRIIEDENESRGEFIEVADYIEQIAFQELPLNKKQLEEVNKIVGEFVDENVYASYSTKIENERLLSRVNDNNNHCIQSELDKLRILIRRAEGNEEQNRKYENLIFKEEYSDKVTQIRQVIYPFIFNGTIHINKERQNEWLAIIEPLKQIDGLLIVHEEKRARKNCTDVEICKQLKLFYGEEIASLNFEKIPKSISEERKKWKNTGVGLTFSDWSNFIQREKDSNKYMNLARIAQKVYGEIKKVIKRQ